MIHGAEMGNFCYSNCIQFFSLGEIKNQSYQIYIHNYRQKFSEINSFFFGWWKWILKFFFVFPQYQKCIKFKFSHESAINDSERNAVILSINQQTLAHFHSRKFHANIGIRFLKLLIVWGNGTFHQIHRPQQS